MSRFGNQYIGKRRGDRDQSRIIDTPISTPLTIGSVIDVIQSKNKSIGEILVAVKNDDGTFTNKVACPLSPHLISLPLPNERVSLMQDGTSSKWYYLSPLSRNGFVNHMSNGIKRVFKEGTDELYLGKTFTPAINLRTLNIYEGDVLFQGRGGQSLRFGSMRDDNNTPWSGGTEGLPIITLRTGVSQVEDLDIDFSSIYLTSGQKLPIQLKSQLPSNFTSPEVYDGDQIIATSKRITLYTKDENIILSSAKDIALSTSKWAVDITILLDQITDLCDNVIKISDQVYRQGLFSASSTHVSAAPGSPTTTSINAPQFQSISNEAANTKTLLQQIKNKVDNMKQ